MRSILKASDLCEPLQLLRGKLIHINKIIALGGCRFNFYDNSKYIPEAAQQKLNI